MRYERLDLHHQAALTPGLSELASEISEYSFANLYLFRRVHSYELLFDDELYILGSTYDGARFVMPSSLASLQALAKRRELMQGVDMVFPISEKLCALFDLSTWQKSVQDDESDYLFGVTEMATYKGLSKKRNLVKQFLEKYQVQVMPLTAATAHLACGVVEKWTHEEAGDIDECLEAIKLLDVLKLQGMIYLVDDQAIGLLLGEHLSKETFVIHFAKADLHYKGIYQYMYQHLAKDLEAKYSFLNLEQDLGIPELRQAKHSYHPSKMCLKFRLYRR